MGVEQEVAVKHARIRACLDEAGYDAVVLTTHANFAWITGGGSNYINTATEAGVASVLVTRDAKYIITANNEADRIMTEEIMAGQGPGHGYELRVVNWCGPGTIEDEIGRLTRDLVVASDTGIAGSKLEARRIAELRFSLTPEEIERYRALGSEVEVCMRTLCRGLTPGLSENEIAGRFGEMLLARGIMPVVTLVAADERIARYRHPIHTDAKVERTVMIITCARRRGLIIACTRHVHFGPLPDETRRKHDAVVKVDAALNLTTKIGAPLSSILAVGQKAYADAGFADEWRLHHQGGSIGYAPRDVVAKPGEQQTVLVNQAFAWNPSITGTKSEDTMLVTKDGIEWLTLSAEADWPMLDVEFDGRTVQREDILVL
jgi:Xaa-Pro aminopeptidase